MKKLLAVPAALALLILAGCGPAGTGTLAGTVTIGPLTPVETPGQPTEVPCEVYEARKVVIFTESGRRHIKDVSIDCDGHYAAELAAGTYTVDINHAGIDRAGGLPAKVKITADQTTTLDINIDTGIR